MWVRMKGVPSRAPERDLPTEGHSSLICRPLWVEQAAAGIADDPGWATQHVVLCDLDDFFPASVDQEIAARIPGASSTRLRLGGSVGTWYADAAIGLFGIIKDALARTGSGRTQIQVLVPRRGDRKSTRLNYSH